MTRVVLAEGNGKYRSARIEVGREADDQIEVLLGLTEQDRVVTSAHFMLDSESSQSADLARISSSQETGVEPPPETQWAKGEITDVMADFGMITLAHQPVEAWRWDAGEMNFSVDGNVDLEGFAEGQTVRFQVEKNGAEYTLKALELDGGTQ